MNEIGISAKGNEMFVEAEKAETRNVSEHEK